MLGDIAGLTFLSLGSTLDAVENRLAVLFFLNMMLQLLPFAYMSFFVADRQFFAVDSANGLYRTSAYYIAAMTSSKQ